MKRFLKFEIRQIPLLALILALSCTDNDLKNNMSEIDKHSFAIPNEAKVTHLDLNLKVDFITKTLSGYVDLLVENKTHTKQLILDSRDLTLEKIEIDGNSQPTEFKLGDTIKYLGQSLTIKITPDTKKVRIYYRTSAQSSAIQWLDASQTSGGKHPFMFTQSQAILARSWVPLQDGPGVKFTYNATITCPSNLMALMSAENDTAKHVDGIYHFKQAKPIPSYLMALAVGDIAFKKLGDNCGIYAEPNMLEKAAWEFADMGTMIKSAEGLYGKYLWGQYDVLVLPPSFPFGGMENPCLTFATPTVIAGDRSLVSLVAHELAHSWSGNLVTNATWDDFWLNEGFTVYFEHRIMEKIYGKLYVDMLCKLELDEMKKEMSEMGDTNPDTKLKLKLAGRDPDEGVTDIAYIKGCFFLQTIENTVGREKWDQFVNTYFKTFAFKSITTERFLEYLNSELIKGNKQWQEKIKINEWVYGTGLPSNYPNIQSSELHKSERAAKEFTNPEKLDTKGWTTHHWLHFLRSLPKKIALKDLEKLDAKFKFTQSGNCEILCDWFQIAIVNHYEAAYKALEKYLCTVGRRKFVEPLYEKLLTYPQIKALAKDIYCKARPSYHTVTRTTIDQMMENK
ncbi:MAG: M1 family metallopeptidase [Bacteroidota bacterium]|nr:M1 family metallopeptidase [Bacteroidota bacterium]